MLGIKEYKFNSFECEDFQVTVWKREQNEDGEDFEISIEKYDDMEEITFKSVDTLDIAIEALQKAKNFVSSQNK